MVEAHTFSLAYIQTGSDEIEPSDGEFCSRCHEDVEWSEIVRQRTVFNNRRRLVDSRWHKFQLYNRLENFRLRRTVLKQKNASSKCKTISRCEAESR